MTRLIAILTICAAIFVATVTGVGAGQHGASAGQVVLVDATPNTATNVINTDHTVTATVTLNNTPLSGATVIFSITSGPNTGQTASPTTDVNGQATFTYTGAGGVGVDAISACIFTLPLGRVQLGVPLACDNVTKDWISPSPTASATATASATPTTSASAVAATASPTPTFNAPAQLPVTGGGSSGSSGFPWVIVVVSAVSAAAFVGGRLILRRVR